MPPAPFRRLILRALGLHAELGRLRSLVTVVATIDGERHDRLAAEVADLRERLLDAEARLAEVYVPEYLGNL